MTVVLPQPGGPVSKTFLIDRSSAIGSTRHGQHDLPPRGPVPVGPPRLGEREHRVHHRPKLPLVDQASDLPELPRVRLHDEERRAGARVTGPLAGDNAANDNGPVPPGTLALS